jgi:beta-lactamase class A
LSAGLPPLAAEARPALYNLGVSALGTQTRWFVDEGGPYPLANLAKLPIAAAALAVVDSGHLRLGSRLSIGLQDLSPPPSRINDHLLQAHGAGGLSLPLADLIALAIQNDDSTASDVLLRQIGGPSAVTAWVRGKGIEGLRIDRSDRERLCDLFDLGPFQSDWASRREWETAQGLRTPAAREAALDFALSDLRDTASAAAAVSFLEALASGSLVSPASTGFLLDLMTTADPDEGLALGLPKGVSVARKAGAAPTTLGITMTDNELALISFPGGPRLAVAVFVTGATDTSQARARIFGQTGRLLAKAANSA